MWVPYRLRGELSMQTGLYEKLSPRIQIGDLPVAACFSVQIRTHSQASHLAYPELLAE